MLFYFALLSLSQTTVTHFNEFCPKIVKISSDFFNKLFLFYDSFCHFHHKIIFFAFYCTLQNPMHYNFWTKIVNFGHCAPPQNFSFLSYWWYYYQLLDEPSLPNLSGCGLKTCQNMPRPPKYKWCHFAVKPGSNPWIMAVEMNTNDI